MSIKIIKNTMIDPVEMTCPVCKSVFSYTFDEIKRAESFNFLGISGVKRFIICPVCKSDIDMSPRVEIKEGEK